MKYSGNSGAIKASNDSLVVSGAGTSALNGTYAQSSDYNGKPSWVLGADLAFVLFDGAKWVITDETLSENYINASTASLPPKTGWTTDEGTQQLGVLPVPTLSYGAAAIGEAKSYTITTSSDVIEAVKLGTEWKENVQGLKSWEIAIEAHYDPADFAQAMLVEGATVEFLLYPSAEVAGRESFTGTGVVTAVSIPVESTSVVAYNLTITGNGEIARGTV